MGSPYRVTLQTDSLPPDFHPDALPHHRPAELSDGEPQRVAVARALTSHPKLLLAGEPTGQLGLETDSTVMILLRNVVRAEGVTAIVANHDPMMLDPADRVVELRDGALV